MTEMAGDESGLAVPVAGERPRTRRRPLGRRLVLAFCGAIVAGLAVGFVGFAQTVTRKPPPTDPRAEGIVVLTGGTARIDGALQLLAEGRADRLLISGVNPTVTRGALAGTVDGNLRRVLDCCVDVDNARDTIENASETSRWAASRNIKSLIVVTSDYHMPRTLAELGEAMPDVALTPFPVTNPELHLDDWWRDPGAFAFLVREYGKYLAAEARNMVSNRAAARTAHD